jgi:hypothetical protein
LITGDYVKYFSFKTNNAGGKEMARHEGFMDKASIVAN